MINKKWTTADVENFMEEHGGNSLELIDVFPFTDEEHKVINEWIKNEHISDSEIADRIYTLALYKCESSHINNVFVTVLNKIGIGKNASVSNPLTLLLHIKEVLREDKREFILHTEEDDLKNGCSFYIEIVDDNEPQCELLYYLNGTRVERLVVEMKV